MDSHITGPWKSGYGALDTVRGKVIDFSLADGEYELGVIQASPEKPVLFEIMLLDEEAFDDAGAPDVTITVELEDESQSWPLAWTDEIGPATYTGNNPDTIRHIVRANARVFVTVATLASTAGRTTAICRASGLGQLPLTV